MGVDVDAISKRLRSTECPAFWELDRLECKRELMINKLEEKNEEIAGQLWRNIILELAITYEYMKKSLLPVCSQKLQDCLIWVENSDDRDFIKKYETSFRHLIQSFKAFIAIEKSDHAEASRCMSQVVDLNKMSKAEQAAVYGIKGNVFTEYGVEGTREAFFWARKALELDSSESEWYFLLGKLHSRQRNYTLIRDPCPEEYECLEKAHEMNKKAHTAVYLATSYSNRGKNLFYKQPISAGKRTCEPKTEIEIKKYYQRALELFRDAMNLNEGQCLHILARCAYGFACLPDEFQNTKLAMDLAEKVIERSPDNAMVHSLLSVIYRNRREFTAAIIHAKRSANAGAFGSHLKLFNLYATGKKEFDIVSCIDRVLAEFPLDIYRIQLYIYASNYFLFIKRDLFKSLPYFEKALDLDPKFNMLKDRFVRWVKVYLNLFELMYNEIECAIRKESYANEDEKRLLLRIRDKIAATWPKVTDMVIEKDLVNKLKENSTSFMRARPRTRKNKKGKKDMKRKKDKTDSRRRLKSTQSASARSKENTKSEKHKVRSSSDDRFYNIGARSKMKNENEFYPLPKRNQNKRALSQDGRSQSRDCPKKMQKEMEKLQKSITDLHLSGMTLRPDSSPFRTSFNLERSMSQLSIERESTPREIPKEQKPNYFSKRSVSFDRQNVPQKRISAAVNPSKPLSDKDSFLPDFKTPPSVRQYGSLTVENVEKFKNSVRRDSLDSDDTLESQMSNLSLRESSNVAVCSATSVSVTTNRSLSLDDSQRSVSSGVGKDKSQSEATDWATMSENDPYVSAFEPDLQMPSDRKALQSSRSLAVKDRHSKPVEMVNISFKPGWANQTVSAQRMSDLNTVNNQLRKSERQSDCWRPSLGASPMRVSYTAGGYVCAGQSRGGQSGPGDYASRGRGGYGGQGRGGQCDPRGYGGRGRGGQGDSRGNGDRRSPFGREQSSEGRVLRPPGMRRRAESETSTSSADSDYIASRWSKGGPRKFNK